MKEGQKEEDCFLLLKSEKLNGFSAFFKGDIPILGDKVEMVCVESSDSEIRIKLVTKKD